MNKLLTFTALVFVLLASTFTAAAQTVSVSPSTVDDLCPFDTFKVNITFDSGNKNLRAITLDLDYNETALEVVNVTKKVGSDWLEEPTNELAGDTNQDGIIHFGAAKTGDYVPASGTLMTVEFRVKDVADGEYALDFQNVRFTDQDKNDIDVNKMDGIATVSCVQAEKAAVEVVPSTVDDLCPSDPFTADVNVDSGNSTLRAISLDLDYNETVLEVVDVIEGDIFEDYLVEPGSGDTEGYIHYGMTRTGENYLPASGTFITVEFKVKDSAKNGDYLLDPKKVTLTDENKEEIKLNIETSSISISCEKTSHSNSGGGGGTGGGSTITTTTTVVPTSTATTSPTASVTQTAKPTATPTATPTPTPSATPTSETTMPSSTATDTPSEEPTGEETTEAPATPGFEAVMVIAVLTVTYLISRRTNK